MRNDSNNWLPSGTLLKQGSYRVERDLGGGGYGITYLAKDKHQKPVAIKEFFPLGCFRAENRCLMPGGDQTADNLYKDKNDYLREALRLNGLNHSNIVNVLDLFLDNDTIYLVMEYLPGQTLWRYTKSQPDGRLDALEAVRIIGQIGEALSFLHSQTPMILHRDVKPENIQIMPNGKAILLDFGAAREIQANQTQALTTIQTAGYAPHEQNFDSGRWKASLDVYALAATLHFLLTGQKPINSLVRYVEDHLPSPQTIAPAITKGLSDAVMQGMALMAEDRPQTVQAFLHSLHLEVTPTTKVNPKDGAVMVWIPAGEFLMGDDDQKDNPRHQVTLSGYWIYKDLVTVGMYKKFCQATGKKMPRTAPSFDPNWSKEDQEDHPMVEVSWDDATDYCTWASEGGVKVTLPTEAQWEKAARGTDGRKYPWGETWDASKCANSVGQSLSGTVAVGQYTDSPYHLSDMAGNVWQWCADWYDTSHNTRVLRGGSWYDNDSVYFRASYRAWGSPDIGDDGDGFRGVAAGL